MICRWLSGGLFDSLILLWWWNAPNVTFLGKRRHLSIRSARLKLSCACAGRAPSGRTRERRRALRFTRSVHNHIDQCYRACGNEESRESSPLYKPKARRRCDSPAKSSVRRTNYPRAREIHNSEAYCIVLTVIKSISTRLQPECIFSVWLIIF